MYMGVRKNSRNTNIKKVSFLALPNESAFIFAMRTIEMCNGMLY